ncbi:MAG: extracellular solute-binding protein, partial [Clostridia bacterium]
MKKLLAFVLATMMLLSLVSFASAEAAPVTITIWHTRPESDEPTSTHQRILAWAEEYNKTNTDHITVEVVGSKKDDAILTSIASGTTPDIFMGYWNTTSTWAANGALMDLTDYINNDATFDKADFADVGWGQATFNNRIYGVPFIMNTTLLYYRADLLKAAGYSEPPKTLEELRDMAIALTKYDDAGNIVQAGFIPDYPWQDNVCWPVMTGAQWIDQTTNTITFDSDAMKEAYQWQADIYSALDYNKLIAFKDGLGTRDTTEDPLITGKVAMTFYSEMKLPPMEELGKDIEWGVCALPHGTAISETADEVMLTTNQFKINANCANPDAAWKVLSSL